MSFRHNSPTSSLNRLRTDWRDSQPGSRRVGFTLTELLVVIAIIVLLLGILLVAIGKVQARARESQTESVMRQFANACSAFQAENGRYPGVISEVVLASTPIPQISSTENALLDLQGGFRVLGPTDDTNPDSAAEVDYNNFLATAQGTNSDLEFTWNVTGGGVWKLAVDTRKIGEGPVINGKPHAPYFTPGPSDLARARYPASSVDPSNDIPDLIDAWGQPIVYLRQLRDRGPLVAVPTNDPAPQFLRGGLVPYIESTALGELANGQTNASNPAAASILNTAPDLNLTLARVLQHPAIANQAKGAFRLISAGPDGIFFSRADGPGTDANPVDDIINNPSQEFNNPKVVDSYDDVRVFGGG